MTLIVKELIVKGKVISENSNNGDFSFEKEHLMQHLEKLKKDIAKDCMQKVLRKIDNKSTR